jgi:hypothetical protein
MVSSHAVWLINGGCRWQWYGSFEISEQLIGWAASWCSIYVFSHFCFFLSFTNTRQENYTNVPPSFPLIKQPGNIKSIYKLYSRNALSKKGREENVTVKNFLPRPFHILVSPWSVCWSPGYTAAALSAFLLKLHAILPRSWAVALLHWPHT